MKTLKNIFTRKSNQKAFTLVELIIVITILAILGTIAFMSYQGYIKNARDSNRTTTLKNIESGLEMYYVKTSTYPIPENIIGTGIIDGIITNYVGKIGSDISNKIGVNKGPTDPLINTNYVYGTNTNQTKYQIAATMENPYKSKVVGNYIYPLKIGKKLYSLPSLIFVGTGNLINNSTGFVINNSQNIPYKLDGDNINTQIIPDLLKEITGSSATLTLTGVDISSYATSTDFKNSTTTTLEQTFGIKKEELGQAIFGKNYISDTTIVNSGGGEAITYTDPNAISEATCTGALWYWVDDATDTIGSGFCISPRITGGTEYISWMDIGTSRSWTRTNASPMTGTPAYANNVYGVTYDLGNYDCKILGTATSGFTKSDNSDSISVGDDILVNRMRYLSKYKTDSTKLDDVNIDWVTIPSIPNGFTIPALYLSDCIDGIRDLTTGKTYEGVTYEQYSAPPNNVTGRQNMNKYLLGWSKVSGSHLPSAYSDIAGELRSDVNVYKGEYQIACENSKLEDANDDTDNKLIRLSSVGVWSVYYWGDDARVVGDSGCSSQTNYHAGFRTGNVSARFVVR